MILIIFGIAPNKDSLGLLPVNAPPPRRLCLITPLSDVLVPFLLLLAPIWGQRVSHRILERRIENPTRPNRNKDPSIGKVLKQRCREMMSKTWQPCAGVESYSFNTPFIPLRDKNRAFRDFRRNSIALRERIEQGSL